MAARTSSSSLAEARANSTSKGSPVRPGSKVRRRVVAGRVVQPGADLVGDHRPQRLDAGIECRPVDRLALAAGTGDRGRQDRREVDRPEHPVQVVPLGACTVVEPGVPVDDAFRQELLIDVGVEHRPLQRVAAVKCVASDRITVRQALATGRAAARRGRRAWREAQREVAVEQFGEHRLVVRVLDERGAEHRAQVDAPGQVDELHRPRRVEHLGDRNVHAATPEVGDEAFDLRPDRVLATGHRCMFAHHP